MNANIEYSICDSAVQPTLDFQFETLYFDFADLLFRINARFGFVRMCDREIADLRWKQPLRAHFAELEWRYADLFADVAYLQIAEENAAVALHDIGNVGVHCVPIAQNFVF